MRFEHKDEGSRKDKERRISESYPDIPDFHIPEPGAGRNTPRRPVMRPLPSKPEEKKNDQ